MVEARLTPKPVPQPRRFLRAAAACLLVGAWTFGFMLRARPEAMEEWWRELGCTRSHCGYSAATSLKTIQSAQADFRANDRDGNRILDYWREDIAGLYTLKSRLNPDGEALKLIELSVASADDRPVTDLLRYAVKSQKYGYWFRSLLHEDEETPAPDRFAACAFPDSRADGKYTYITDETNVIYRKDLKRGRGVERFPRDPLKAGWERIH
jgi:hypothetical protein